MATKNEIRSDHPTFVAPRGMGQVSRRAQQMTWQVLVDLRQQQSALLAYFDVFFLFAALSAALILLVPLMKRSVAEKGSHVGAE